ncbi:MAG: pentapeptide repeat-containing protein [Anaerolineae bacterium]
MESWRRKTSAPANLSHLDLSEKTLPNKNFGVDLSHANLCEANLSRNRFPGSEANRSKPLWG